MNTYAILDKNNIVSNKAVANQAQAANWEICPDEVQIGWKCEGNGNWSSPIDVSQAFLKNTSIKANGTPVLFFADNHYANVDDSVEITTDIVDAAGNLQTLINFPIPLKLPVVRHADGQPTTDEVYMNFTVTAGKFTATCKFTRSGDWKILIHRLNGALERLFKAANTPIEYQFTVKADDITIIV